MADRLRAVAKVEQKGTLSKSDLREFFREPGLIFWVFGFPILMAIGLGLAFRSQPPERPVVALLAPEDSALGRALRTRGHGRWLQPLVGRTNGWIDLAETILLPIATRALKFSGGRYG